jgi:neutral ceramidase
MIRFYDCLDYVSRVASCYAQDAKARNFCGVGIDIFVALRQCLACLSFLTFVASFTTRTAFSELKAGAAIVNITPPLGELIVGGFHPYPAEDVHDELHARCIVLDDGATKLAFVVCDNVGISREVFDYAKEAVEKKLQIPASHQLMAATHTHSATTARSKNMLIAGELSEYQSFLARRIIDGIQMANLRLEAAELGWGSVDEPSELFNRRWFVANEADRRNPFGGVDQVRMNPPNVPLIRPAGPTDPQVSFFTVRSLKDRHPIALLANYSLHYVGGVTGRAISADYFGVFAEELGKLMKIDHQSKPFVAILSNGTSGDVNNNNFLDRSAKHQPYQKMRQVGQLIATRVHGAMQTVSYQGELRLDARKTELSLRVRKPDAQLLAYCENILKKPADEKPYHPHEKIYAERVMMQASSPDEVNVPLQTIRIGSLGIAAIPFEVFTETGLEIKERSPFQPSFTMELANGSYGYLPPPRHHDLGGYETWLGTNKVERQASEKIVEKLMAMFGEMKPSEPTTR